MLPVSQWLVGVSSTPRPASQKGNISVGVLGEACVRLQVRENLSNVNLNEQRCLGLSRLSLETDLSRACISGISWPFPDACCLMVERRPLHLQPSHQGSKQEEGGRAGTKGPGIDPLTSAGEQSLVQKLHPLDFGPQLSSGLWVSDFPAARVAGNTGLSLSSLHRRHSE